MDSSTNPSLWLRYAAALCVVAVATALRIWPLGALELRVPYVTFYPAVMVAALYGGITVGLLATILSALVILFWSPTGQPFIKDFADWLGMSIFLINCTVIALISEGMRRAQARARVAQHKAEAANRAKSQFLANMSHELRTPLNAVIGFSQLMAKDPALSAIQQRNLDIISRSGNNLLTLINDVLEFSKIESGRVQMTIEETNLAGLLREIIEMVQVHADQAGLTLALETSALPDGVMIDVAKLRQILLNLLTNALKFTSKGGVVVSVKGRMLENGKVRLEFAVEDTGCGIAPEDAQRIFEPFEQAGPSAVKQSGVGLGLAISRQYVRMMGGDLGVQSTPGQGSRFSFTIDTPVCTAPPVREPHVRIVALAEADRGRRILVADDIEEARLLLRSLLEPFGFEVKEAANGAEAVEMTAAFRPHAILMDWRMPVVDGLEAVRRIRGMEGVAQPKIIMVTAHAFEEERQVTLAAGADEFMRKPVKAEELYAILEKQLAIHFEREGAVATLEEESPSSLTAAEMEALSPEMRERLTAAVRELNQKKIAQALLYIQNENPQLAARIKELSDTMRHRQLWQILGIYDSGNGTGK